MADVITYNDTCKIRMSQKSRESDAVVTGFKEHDYLHVIVNKSVKISLKWNGSAYEGRSAGMDFESDGPTISKIVTGSRR